MRVLIQLRSSKVAQLKSAAALKAKGMDGKGLKPRLNVAKSWTPAGVATTAGKHPVHHGTMCAFDTAIAAPRATLLDYAVLLSQTPGATVMAGLLSDASSRMPS